MAKRTKLQQQIDATTSEIPDGYWTTYGAIGKSLGLHQRTVSNAVVSSSKVKGWRVLKAGGVLPDGFRWNEDSEYSDLSQKDKLQQEGVVFDESNIADSNSFWAPKELRVNSVALKGFIERYKATFDSHRPGKDGELYKLEAIKHFQDNWEPDASDFYGMLKQSLAKTGNLLAARHVRGREYIEDLAKLHPSEVREMFKNLFDESKDFATRIDNFWSKSKELGKPQSAHDATVYLWLRYPEKYSIYKYEVGKVAGEKLLFGSMPVDPLDRIIYSQALTNKIWKEIQSDKDLLTLSSRDLTDAHYQDAEYRLLALDVIYFIAERDLELQTLSDAAELAENQVFNKPDKLRQVWTRANQGNFRKALLARYSKCHICGITDLRILESAHLKHRHLGGPDETDNGRLLCANHHSAYDAGGLFEWNEVKNKFDWIGPDEGIPGIWPIT